MPCLSDIILMRAFWALPSHVFMTIRVFLRGQACKVWPCFSGTCGVNKQQQPANINLVLAVHVSGVFLSLPNSLKLPSRGSQAQGAGQPRAVITCGRFFAPSAARLDSRLSVEGVLRLSFGYQAPRLENILMRRGE